jgi:hypothetical protein
VSTRSGQYHADKNKRNKTVLALSAPRQIRRGLVHMGKYCKFSSPIEWIGADTESYTDKSISDKKQNARQENTIRHDTQRIPKRRKMTPKTNSLNTVIDTTIENRGN